MNTDRKARITLAVHCHNYQRRFCWMLSSLAQQTDPHLVVVDVACMPGNGDPNTESVASAFAEITCRCSVWQDYSVFQKRGEVRNRQLRECDTEWILFSDCDMVYHPQYFSRLVRLLDESHSQATYMLSSGRMSNPKEEANQLVETVGIPDDCHVTDAFHQSKQLTLIKRGNVGAGFSQLINVRTAPHAGYYVRSEENRDWSWDKRGHKSRSDIQFRRRIAREGGPRQALPKWFSRNLIHINHNRDNEFGVHLKEQR